MKHNLLKTMLVAMGFMFTLPVSAQDSTADFSNCLTDALNGKERRELAKWIFMSISVHPSIENYAKIEQSERDATNKYIGELVTRLLTKSCPAELKEATKENPLAVQQGFEFVGKVAMQELMANEATMKALTAYAQYADLDAITAITTDK